MALKGHLSFYDQTIRLNFWPKVQNLELYEEIGIQTFSDFIFQVLERPQAFRFFRGSFCYLPMPSLKRLSKKLFEGWRKTLSTLSFFLNFCKNHYNSAENIQFLARPTFSISAIFSVDDKRWLIGIVTPRGAHFLLSSRVHEQLQNWLCVEGKQTVVQ